MISAPIIVTPRPNRGARRAAAPEETRMPSENGRKVSPACSAVKPRPSCRNRVSTSPNEAIPRKNVSAMAIPTLNSRRQIGRASCRERVEISVGAVSLKKKKEEKEYAKREGKRGEV